jgi:hypothetical protein
MTGAPPTVVVPRQECHRVVLDIKGISKRQAGASIGLQLAHLTGLPALGYAWKLVGDRAHVWYWAENLPAEGQPDRQPCPEMLLRPTLPSGLHLVTCSKGFEAIHVAMGAVNRSRWFSEPPGKESWVNFVRDAGLDPNLHPVKTPQSLSLRQSSEPGWSVQSNLLHPLGTRTWLVLLGIALVGAALVGLISYQVKLAQHIESVRVEHASLSKESAVALRLQAQIDEQKKSLSLAAFSQPKTVQLKLMAQLASAGLFDEATKVTLQEWEFRNNRVRMQFGVPAEGFELGKFLASLESLGLLSEVRLLSGTPPQAVAIQASLTQDAAQQRIGAAAK